MVGAPRGEEALAVTKIQPTVGAACQTQEREEGAELEPVQSLSRRRDGVKRE